MNYENEIWRDIIIEKNGIIYDYTGLYQVSNYGRVKSLGNDKKRKEKILKPIIYNNGYQNVGLSKNGEIKTFSVHRLVATAFVPNPDNLLVVNHKNETKTDNVWTNLEWCTVQYNTNYGTAIERQSKKKKGDKNPMYGITGDKHPSAKKVICLETKQVFGCIKDAQEWLGKGNIKHCLAGRNKTAGGYHWMYLDDYKCQLRMNTDINNYMATCF